ncbi:MAG: hypothetical protein HYU36_25685 [Planctomycetes bacterium]|nr:hypothetical protein [Planctomycetota bacterium]
MVLGGGTVKGKVTLDGAAPAPEMLKISEDKAKDCGHEKETLVPANDLIVSKEGGVKNFVISLVQKGSKVEPKKVEFDQQGCMFTAPVLAVPVGSTIVLKNSDKGSHNIRTSPLQCKPINLTLAPGQTQEYPVTASENFQVNCDIHPWMKAMISVVDTNIYVLTGENGEFEIKDVPAGDYEFKAWHPVAGKAKEGEGAPRTLKVEDGKTVELVIKKAPKKK